MTRHMTALEEYDLRQAFEALDDAQSGRLSLRNVQTMALAYGYQYQKSPRLTLALLRSLVPGDENSNDWTIATVLGVFQKLTRAPRDSMLDEAFDLVAGGQSVLTMDHVRALAEANGHHLSLAEASRMLEHAHGQLGTYAMHRQDWHRLFSPPEP